MRLLKEHAEIEPRFGVADDALERWSNDFEHWLSDDAYRIFVAEQAGEIVGFITACMWQPLPIYAPVEEVSINELYVVPEVRGRGMGRQLVAAVDAWAETLSIGRLRIGVLAANTEGRAFWAHLDATPFLLTLTIEREFSESNESPGKKKTKLGF